MPIQTDTHVEHIDLTAVDELEETIKNVCDVQGSRDQPRRLAASFATRDQVILIFQRASK